DGRFEVDGEASHINELPFWIGRCRARAPDTIAAPRERAQTVHANGIQDLVLREVDVALEAERATDHFVGRGLRDALLDVVTSVDAGNEAGRREVDLQFNVVTPRTSEGVWQRYPWIVERGAV